MKKNTACKALALRQGPAPRRQFPETPEVIALGPGSKRSPYQPEEIERAFDRWCLALQRAIDTALIVATRDARGLRGFAYTDPIWNASQAVAELQHAGIVYYVASQSV